MKEQLKKLQQFHQVFEIKEGVNNKPSLVSGDTYNLRYDLMKEENNEYFEACLNNDLLEIADALGDMLYILLGTMNCHGMQDVIEDIFDEIHTSNMSKLGEDGKPIINGQNGVNDLNFPNGKVLKPLTYRKPNIEKILMKL